MAGTPIKTGKNMAQSRLMTSLPSGSVPSKAGQTSGEVKHGRSGKKTENMKDLPKNGAAH